MIKEIYKKKIMFKKFFQPKHPNIYDNYLNQKFIIKISQNIDLNLLKYHSNK